MYYKTFKLGHESFAAAKDMTWFSGDLMNMLNHYNGRSTQDEKFI